MNNRGMTLVEIMAAVAIIAVSSLILVACFGVAANLTGRAADRQANADSAYSAIESGGAQAEVAVVSFWAGQTVYHTQGYISVVPGSGFYSFAAK